MFQDKKLMLGKLLSAWRAYPQERIRLKEMPFGQPILVTGTHRSGTTWFGRMLAASGIWHIHEPFAPYQGLWNEWFSYARADEDHPEIDRLMQTLLAGGYRNTLQLPWADHPLMPLRLLPQPIHRVLIKDPIASLMSEYLTRNFDMHTFVLFRHPAAVVESVTRLGWSQSGAILSFLNNEKLMADWLEPCRSAMEAVTGKEGIETAAVLHACLCRVLWGYVGRNDRMEAVEYERLCQNPVEEFARIFSRLALPYDKNTESVHHAMCYSDRPEVGSPHEVRRNSIAMVTKWKLNLAREEISSVRRIWERFEVPLYLAEEAW